MPFYDSMRDPAASNTIIDAYYWLSLSSTGTSTIYATTSFSDLRIPTAPNFPNSTATRYLVNLPGEPYYDQIIIGNSTFVIKNINTSTILTRVTPSASLTANTYKIFPATAERRGVMEVHVGTGSNSAGDYLAFHGRFVSDIANSTDFNRLDDIQTQVDQLFTEQDDYFYRTCLYQTSLNQIVNSTSIITYCYCSSGTYVLACNDGKLYRHTSTDSSTSLGTEITSTVITLGTPHGLCYIGNGNIAFTNGYATTNYPTDWVVYKKSIYDYNNAYQISSSSVAGYDGYLMYSWLSYADNNTLIASILSSSGYRHISKFTISGSSTTIVSPTIIVNSGNNGNHKYIGNNNMLYGINLLGDVYGKSIDTINNSTALTTDGYSVLAGGIFIGCGIGNNKILYRYLNGDANTLYTKSYFNQDDIKIAYKSSSIPFSMIDLNYIGNGKVSFIIYDLSSTTILSTCGIYEYSIKDFV